MTKATGVDFIRSRIHGFRADADINEAEARRLRSDADELEQRVADARRIADELEALLPTEEEAAE